jgi:hypothetical protein
MRTFIALALSFVASLIVCTWAITVQAHAAFEQNFVDDQSDLPPWLVVPLLVYVGYHVVRYLKNEVW